MFGKCIICGCTERNACLVGGAPCGWAIPGELCDNPACLTEAEVRIAADDEESANCGTAAKSSSGLLMKESGLAHTGI
jgi:hypothetical protein